MIEKRPAERSSRVPVTTLNGTPHDFGDKHPKRIAIELTEKRKAGYIKRLEEIDARESELKRLGY